MLEVPLTIKHYVKPFWFPVLPEAWSSGAVLSPLQCPWFFHCWSQNIQFQKFKAAIRGCSHEISSMSSGTRLQRLQQPTGTDSKSKQVVRGEVTELLLSI